MTKEKMLGTPEILGAFLNDADTQALKADATSYIKEKSGIDLSDNEVHIVENNEAIVHIALPYYTNIESPPATINEDNLDASGGFFTAYRPTEMQILQAGDPLPRGVLSSVSFNTRAEAEAYIKGYNQASRDK